MNKPLPSFGTRSRRSGASEMLTSEQERHLVSAWQDRGDVRSRDRLIAAFAPLAATMVRRFKPASDDVAADLLQQANIGLVKAADRFDPIRENRFSTYAIWWIRAELQDFMRSNMSVVRRPNSAQFRKAARHIAALDARIDAEPDMDRATLDAQIADRLGIDIGKVATLRAQVMGKDHSLNIPAMGEEGEERIAHLADPDTLDDPVPLQNLQTAGLRRALVEALANLPDRERDIVVATQVMDPPATLEKLGVRYGISKERVRQLRERGFERLRVTLRGRDIGPESMF